MHRNHYLRISGAFLALTILLSACSLPKPAPAATQAAPAATAPAATATALPATKTAPAATVTAPAPTATTPAASTTAPTKPAEPLPAPTLKVMPTIRLTAVPVSTKALERTIGKSASVTMSLAGVAQSFTSQIIAAVLPSADAPYWETMPQFNQLTLAGYPISKHLMKPQVMIYPVDELAKANEGAGKMAANLKTLLENQQAGKTLPFLPMYNAAQVMHTQVKYMNFKNGKGVRFLTQFDQGILPINNYELIYTYQGLTNDGKYYVAAVLPANLASLPADDRITGNEPPEFKSNFSKYLETVVGTLSKQPANAFTPDLSKLDALIQSIEIK